MLLEKVFIYIGLSKTLNFYCINYCVTDLSPIFYLWAVLTEHDRPFVRTANYMYNQTERIKKCYIHDNQALLMASEIIHTYILSKRRISEIHQNAY